VNMAMNLRVPYNAGNFFVAEECQLLKQDSAPCSVNITVSDPPTGGSGSV
jgi:hypothetical protein